MRLLATTSHSVLIVDPASRTIDVVHRGRGLYFGIASDTRGRWFIGARGRMMSSADDRDAEQGSVLVFDRRFRPQGELRADFPMRDIHGMAYFDGALWVTCSRDNVIARFDGTAWTKWHPFDGDRDLTADERHYNTVDARGDRIHVVAHNHGASELHLFDRSTRRHVDTIALGDLAHNTWIEQGEYFTCSSGEAAIVGSNGFRLVTGGFPRGYAAADGVRFVGINEHAPRAARDDTTSTIRMYDQHWQQSGELELPDEGMLLEIVPITSEAAPTSWLQRAASAVRSRSHRAGA